MLHNSNDLNPIKDEGDHIVWRPSDVPELPTWMMDAPDPTEPPAGEQVQELDLADFGIEEPTEPTRKSGFIKDFATNTNHKVPAIQMEINNESAFKFIKTQEPVACPVAKTENGYSLIFKHPDFPVSECDLVPDWPRVDLRLRIGMDPNLEWLEGAALEHFPDGLPNAPGWLLTLIRSAMEWEPPAAQEPPRRLYYAETQVESLPDRPVYKRVRVWVDSEIDVNKSKELFAEKSTVENDSKIKLFYKNNDNDDDDESKVVCDGEDYFVNLVPSVTFNDYIEYDSKSGVKFFIPQRRSDLGKVQTITSHKNGHPHVEFKHDQYISGVFHIVQEHARTSGMCFLKALTGTGKTYEWAHTTGQSILAVPTQALVKQVSKKYHLFGMYEDQDLSQIPEEASKIVTTYDSTKKIVDFLRFIRDEHLAEWNLTVDEAHLLTTEGGYRLKGVNSLTSCFDTFGSVIAMSATLPLDLLRLTYFPDAPLVTCVPNYARERIKLMWCDRDYIAQTKELLGQGIKLVILHANDKAFCEAYRSQFAKENIKAITFTADTKEEEHHEMIINESKIDDDVQVILTTNIYNVGLSIEPGDSHAVIITHKSRLLPRDVCQVAARMRHGAEFQLPTVVLVGTRRKEDDTLENNGQVFDYKKHYPDLLDQAERTIKLCESVREMLLAQNCANKGNLDEVLDKLHENAFVKAPLIYTEPYEINHDGIMARVSDIHRATLTTGQLLFELEETKLFEFAGQFEYQTDHADESVKEKIKENAAQRKARREATYEVIRSGAASQAFEQNAIKGLTDIIENHKDHDKFEVEAASGIMSTYRAAKKLNKRVQFSGVLKLVEGVTSESRFKKIRTEVLFSAANKLTDDKIAQMNSERARLVCRVLESQISDEKAQALCQAIGEGRVLADLKPIAGIRVTSKHRKSIQQIIKDTRVREDALILKQIGELVKVGDKLTKKDVERLRQNAILFGAGSMFDIRTTEKMTRLIKRFFKCKRTKVGPKGRQVDAWVIVERVDHLPTLTL
ncbi:MAG: hypothetical protein ACPGWR_21035 [Ardenticatenaceae bacterium]